MSEKKLKNAMMTIILGYLYGCFLKWWYPKMDGLQWKTLLKWMIWGENPLVSETSISHTPLFRVSGCLGEAHEIELQPGNKRNIRNRHGVSRPFDTVL